MREAKDRIMKKALMIASMASMLDNFNTNNIALLHNMGYQVTLAANFKTREEDNNSWDRVQRFQHRMRKKGYCVYHIDFTRKPFYIKGHIKSYKQVKELSKEDYNLVHCHSPIGAAITRIVFRKERKKGLKVIYTAHGFHFYKGAPLKNWLLYFPAEWICAHWTDMLITINQEDFQFARKWLRAKKVKYIPGVGVDLEKFQCEIKDREEKRKKLGLDKEDIMLLSVGELNHNKNHEIVIRAIAELGIQNIHYIIAGQGALSSYLQKLAKSLKVQNQVRLLGYRDDVVQLYQCADIYVLPSLREGLNVSLMEAMASGLPAIVSDIRGNCELVQEVKGGWRVESTDVSEWKEAISKMCAESGLSRYGHFNREKIKKFSDVSVNEKMREIYASLVVL